jgi:hypothetical protein
MKYLPLLLLLLLSSLSPAQADTIYFLGPDRGVYADDGSGLRRVGLGTGNSLAVHGTCLYLAGDDGQVWSADARGRWTPMPGAKQVKKVVTDSSGTLYVLGDDGGVYRFDGGLTRRGLAVAQDLAVAGNGDLYVVGNDGKVWVCHALLGGKDSWTPYNALAQGKRLAVAPDGTVYLVGNDEGVYRVGPEKIARLGLASAREVAVSSQGEVGIVGTDGGVYLWDGSSRWKRLGSGTARQVIWPR